MIVDPDIELKLGFREICKPISTDSIYAWARKNVVLPERSYVPGGPFNVMTSRYLIEPFDAIKDKDVREVVCCCAVQTGKTLLSDISIAWSAVNYPGHIQLTMATEKMVKDHVKERLYPLFKLCKPLKNLLPEDDRDFTNDGISFPQGRLYVNSQTPSALQNKSIRFAICDEVWRFDSGKLAEAKARTTRYDLHNKSKILVISQPNNVDDDLDTEFKRGTQEHWCVPCMNCGVYFYPEWRAQREDGSFYGLVWESNDITKPDGKWNLEEVMKTVAYECKECKNRHSESSLLKKVWNRDGKYISFDTSKPKKIRSFRWNAIAISPWETLVGEFIKAKEMFDRGVKDNMREFQQKHLAKPWDPFYSSHSGKVRTEIYDVESDWPDEVARFMTIDCQKTHFWINIRAWAADGRSRQLFFGKGLIDDILQLKEKFKIPDYRVYVDVANTEKQEDSGVHLIYEMVDRHRFVGLRGDGWANDRGYTYTYRGRKVTLFVSQMNPIPNSKNGTGYYKFASNQICDILADLRDGKSMEFKSLENEEYETQMVAERKVSRKDKLNNITFHWKNVNNLPNHAWDCEKMMVVATLLCPDVHLIPKPV